MALFTCSACNFSKTVADEMAGKKARCPKCNAVNVVAPLDDQPVIVDDDVEVGSQQVESEPSQPTAESPPPSDPDSSSPQSGQTNVGELKPKPRPATNNDAAAKTPVADAAAQVMQPIPQNWLMLFGGMVGLVLVAVVLFLLKIITPGIVCFAAGIIGFAALSAFYCIKN